MGFFTSTVNGPAVDDMKVTFENLCHELNSDIYTGGVDRDTLITTLEDVYKWIVSGPGKTISLPAVSGEPDDRHRIMFPQGCRVNTRKSRGPSSVSSRNSSNVPKSMMHLSSHYTRPQSTVSSSSRVAPRYVGFVEDDDATIDAHSSNTVLPPYHRNRQGSVSIREVRAQNVPLRQEYEAPYTDRRPPRKQSDAFAAQPHSKQTVGNKSGIGFADD